MRLPANKWREVLAGEYAAPYFAALGAVLEREYAARAVYPPRDYIFRALELTDFDGVRVVILGQDPYHGDGQANGIAFAVNDGVPLPPSLINIYKEIEDDTNCRMPRTGSLLGWASQGVLLLNTTLTVRRGEAFSHSDIGWQQFTDAVIRGLSTRERPMVFMLWGSFARAKNRLIAPRHLVLEAPHPSPLSAYRGFFGCRHFSKANEFLVKNGFPPVDWSNVDGVESGGIKRGRIMRI
ncbi:MAG: uracil-DNA glycosylase [Clostridiales bacterium]|jgi:uracil-DNA glycosylase|nr:uracil-DNA glycosylase [Clostridiales bacterium]